MRLAIFGAGLIGKKRGLQTSGHELVGVYDPDSARAQKLATELGCPAFSSEEELLSQKNLDIAIIATTNNALFSVAKKAILKKVNLLVEKPAATSVAQIEELIQLASENKVAVKVGFNHRFHPAMLKLRSLIDSGALGELMFLRARYGHGGRLGYEKEWRSIPEISGGGELLDQGVHLLDLIYWYLGPLPLQSSLVATSFWKMDVEDNAVLTLKKNNTWATFHVSCSEWKNLFSLEIYGRNAKVLIDGIGGSYGKETLTFYQMLPEMGPPQIETFSFDAEDQSWGKDLQNLVDHLKQKTPLLGDLHSAKYCLEQIRQAYQQNGYKKLPCSV